jgi:hypothetical protein
MQQGKIVTIFIFKKALNQGLSAVYHLITITLRPEKCSGNNKYFKVNVKNRNADEVFFRSRHLVANSMLKKKKPIKL